MKNFIDKIMEIGAGADRSCSEIERKKWLANAEKLTKDFVKESQSELLEALAEISEGKGTYDLDQYKHAYNCIRDMKELAVNAIKKAKQ